jgi:hypothetical protein
MDRHCCQFYASGEQCPKLWSQEAWVLGRRMRVCDAHSGIKSVPEGAAILWRLKMVAMQQTYERTGDAALEKRLSDIAARARAVDKARAMQVYKEARARARASGSGDEERAHEAAILAVWQQARYPVGDPRRDKC